MSGERRVAASVRRFDAVGRDVTAWAARWSDADCEIAVQCGNVRIRRTTRRSQWLDTGFSCVDTVRRLWVSDGIEIFER